MKTVCRICNKHKKDVRAYVPLVVRGTRLCLSKPTLACKECLATIKKS